MKHSWRALDPETTHSAWRPRDSFYGSLFSERCLHVASPGHKKIFGQFRWDRESKRSPAGGKTTTGLCGGDAELAPGEANMAVPLRRKFLWACVRVDHVLPQKVGESVVKVTIWQHSCRRQRRGMDSGDGANMRSQCVRNSPDLNGRWSIDRVRTGWNYARDKKEESRFCATCAAGSCRIFTLPSYAGLLTRP